ncbi:MAG: hypothetical protein FD175_2240 [Beijerinckiaceae bacterium]|nr:MAG: hypothetical protein FD175_2240 [Beijerinckiaceae bacterium]
MLLLSFSQPALIFETQAKADWRCRMAHDTIASSAPIGRIRAIIRTVDLDCECRDKLDLALDRFELLERRRHLRTLIQDARHQAEQIASMLDLLRELDEIRADESDGSVFEELALLFDAIAVAAATGARDMRHFRTLHAGLPAPETPDGTVP